jgi:Undecaprenyl-phosphate glucose phosphotransferase
MPDTLMQSAEIKHQAGTASVVDPSAAMFTTRELGQWTDNWIANNLRGFIAGYLRIADAGLIAAAATTSYAIRNGGLIQSNVYALEVVIAILLTAISFQKMGLYRISYLGTFPKQASKMILTYTGVAAALIILDYLLKVSDQISRIWSVTWFFLSLAMLLIMRVVVWRMIGVLYRAGRLATSVAIVGSRDSVRQLVTHLTPEFGKTLNLVSALDADGDHSAIFHQLAAVSRTKGIDEVLVPLPWNNVVPLETLLRSLRNLPVAVRLIPDIPKTSFSRLSLNEQYGLPVVSVIERPMTGLQGTVKRAEDIVISSIALIVAAPVMLLTALLIKLDGPGPVLFCQDRWGFNARKISVLKFRTMRTDTGPDPSVTQATRNDPRVTRIGRFLRRTSLDELPQLINVLKGEMSLVGPRPHAVAHNEHYMTLIDNYLGRHKVKPGITGLAQVNGCRGITDTIDKMQKRVIYDLRYIDSWSILLDIKIIFLTIFKGFTGRDVF